MKWIHMRQSVCEVHFNMSEERKIVWKHDLICAVYIAVYFTIEVLNKPKK